MIGQRHAALVSELRSGLAFAPETETARPLGEGARTSSQMGVDTSRPLFAERPVRPYPDPEAGRSLLTVWAMLVVLSWALIIGLIVVAMIGWEIAS